jgi:NitT/TauT family transport system permease protein
MRRRLRRWIAIRRDTPRWQAVLLGLLCVALCFALWWYVTRGEGEQRILTSDKVPSPQETFASFRSLWFDRALTRNILVTMERVVLGFGLAIIVGVPLGVLAGCFSRIAAFLSPLIIFGRNIPLAALIPLTIFIFGIGELRTVMFIFIACVAFIISDAADAIADVDTRYIDTAYTLGAKRRHVILKVLVPLAMPSVFNSLRLLFGLAFGYIMLAELFVLGGAAGGLGYLISVSQRRGPREHIYLIILIIPVIALAIDRFLFWVQRELFPYRYGGLGMLNSVVRAVLHLWDDFKSLLWRSEASHQRLELDRRDSSTSRDASTDGP